MNTDATPTQSMSRRLHNGLHLLAVTAFIAFVLLMPGCNGRAAPEQRTDDNDETLVPVIVDEVTLRDLSKFISMTGKLEGITDITMYSETSGRVLSIDKTLGDWIDKGEKFGTLDNEIFRIRLDQAKAALASAKAAMETAKMNYNSTEKLYRNGSLSQAEYQQALFNYQGTVAQRDGAKAGLESARKAFDNSRLISPAAGYISSLHLKVGETITPGAPIAGIVNHSKLLLEGSISEKNILSISKNQPVFINYRGREYQGEVRGLGVKPFTNTSSYPVEIVLENKNSELLPGMVVTARIRSRKFSDVIYTETANIRSRYDDFFVYTIDEESRAVRTNIMKDRDVNEFTIIKEGLQPGDLIVVQGIDSLEDGIKVNITN